MSQILRRQAQPLFIDPLSDRAELFCSFSAANNGISGVTLTAFENDKRRGTWTIRKSGPNDLDQDTRKIEDLGDSYGVLEAVARLANHELDVIYAKAGVSREDSLGSLKKAEELRSQRDRLAEATRNNLLDTKSPNHVLEVLKGMDSTALSQRLGTSKIDGIEHIASLKRLVDLVIDPLSDRAELFCSFSAANNGISGVTLTAFENDKRRGTWTIRKSGPNDLDQDTRKIEDLGDSYGVLEAVARLANHELDVIYAKAGVSREDSLGSLKKAEELRSQRDRLAEATRNNLLDTKSPNHVLEVLKGMDSTALSQRLGTSKIDGIEHIASLKRLVDLAQNVQPKTAAVYRFPSAPLSAAK